MLNFTTANRFQSQLILMLGSKTINLQELIENIMINLIINFFVLFILSMMVAALFLKVTGLSFWWGAAFLACMGVVLYLSNICLIRHFINKKAPGVFELDAAYGRPMKDGEYLWEKTAGTGIVPKWVSMIGMGSYACFAGIVILLITWLM